MLVVPVFLFCIDLVASAQSIDAEPQIALAEHPGPSFGELERRAKSAVEKASQGVVGLSIEGQDFGSGVLISADGWVATAAHLTKEPSREVAAVLADGRVLVGETFGLSNSEGVALVKLCTDGEPLPFVEMSPSSQLYSGQWVVSIGHPLRISTTRGPVARLGKIINSDYIIADTPLTPGDSGGAFVNLDGELVGINDAILPQDVAMNKILPIDRLTKIITALKMGDQVEDPPLAPLPEREKTALRKARTLASSKSYGLAIATLEEVVRRGSSDAVLYYDMACIYSLWSATLHGGEKKDKAKAAVSMLSKAIESGWNDIGHLMRDGELEAIRQQASYKALIKRYREFAKRQTTDSCIGIQLETCDDGVKIRTLADRCLARRAGLREGDLLTYIDAEPVVCEADVARALLEHDMQDLMLVNVVREVTHLQTEALLFEMSFQPIVRDLVPSEYRDGSKSLARWDSVSGWDEVQVFELVQECMAVAHATPIAADGYLITKGSVIQKDKELCIRDQYGQVWSVEYVAYDDASDIALLHVEDEFSSWVHFDTEVAAVESGDLVVSLGSGGQALSQSMVGAVDKGAEFPIAPLGFGGESVQHSSVKVTQVVESSIAADAGLLAGDTITHVNKKPVENWSALVLRIRTMAIGDVLSLRILRDDNQHIFDIILSQDQPATPRKEKGNLPAFFGFTVHDANRVRVDSVEAYGPAFRAGLQEGDVIVSVGGVEVASAVEVGVLLRDCRPGDSIQIECCRLQKGGETQLVIPVKAGVRHSGRAGLGVEVDIDYEGVGCRMKSVSAGSAAHRAGIRCGDILTQLGEQDVANTLDLKAVLTSCRPGQMIDAVVYRCGEAIECVVLLESRESLSPRGAISQRCNGFEQYFSHDGVVMPYQMGAPVRNVHGQLIGLNIARHDRSTTIALPASYVGSAVHKLLSVAAQGK